MNLRGRAAALAPLFGQAGISLSNLLIGVVLIREGTPKEYGLFFLGFSIALFLVGLQDGLVSGPVMVRAGSFATRPRTRYLLWNRRSLFTVTLVVAFVGVLCAGLASTIVTTDIAVGFIFAVVCAGSCWIAWDYQRGEALANRAPGALIRIDLSYFFAIGLGVSIIVSTTTPTATLTLLAIAGAAFAAASVGIGRDRIFERRWQTVARALWLWWNRGRLSLFVSLISWVQSQGYIYICSALLGLEALARVAAARLLFAPLATVLAAWAKGATTRNAELYRQREFAALTRHLVLATIGFALLTLGWCGLILFLQGLLLDVVFKGKYNGMTALIVAWGLTSVVNAWGTIWRLSLRVAANYLSLTRVAMVGAGTSVFIALAAMQWYGEIGAVIGLAAGEAAMALFAVTVFRRSVVRAAARAV